MKATFCFFLVAITLCFPAHAREPEIVQIAPDTYLISAEDHRGIFGNAASMKAKVIRQANEFAAKQGKIAVALSSSERPLGHGPAQWATFEYQFRVVSRSDPEATRSHLSPVSDVTVSIEGQSGPQPQPNQQDDFYEQMIRLDDLRKRGILTEQEFEQAKARLLSK